MRTNQNQDFSTGSLVNVGFLKGLRVTGEEITVTQWGTETAYLLQAKSGQEYKFRPHHGIEKVSQSPVWA